MTKAMNKIKYFILVALFAVASVFAIGCGEDKIKGISVDKESYKATVFQYEDYDFSTIKIIVDMSKGDDQVKAYADVTIYEGNKPVSADFTDVAGDHELTVKYKEFEAKITITVQEIDLESITLDTTDMDLTVYQGSTLDLSALKVKAHYSNETVRNIAFADVTITGASTEAVGTKTCTVTYNGKTETFDLVVEEVDFTLDIDQDALAGQKFYQYQADAADFTGVEINLMKGGDAIDTITFANADVDVDDVNTETSGNKTLKVKYLTAETTIPYTVYELSAIDIKNYPEQIFTNETLNSSNVKVYGIYAEDENKEILLDYAQVQFSALDMDEYDVQTLTATYKGKTDSVEIIVKELMENPAQEKSYTIDSFEDPAFIQAFRANLTGNTKRQNNVRSQAELVAGNKTGFEIIPEDVKNYPYVVGDDNLFTYRPILGTQVFEGGDISIKIKEDYRTWTQIYLWDEETKGYVQLDRYTFDDDKKISTYVEIDDEEHTYDFTDAAIGKQFKIIVKPYFYNEDEEYIIGDGSQLVLRVIDGWNAYTAKDLSMMDNVNGFISNDTDQFVSGKWNGLKTAEEIELSKTIKGMVLHNDIPIYNKDLPSHHFDDAGKTKLNNEDHEEGYIYFHKVASGETFNFEGNYFMISAEDIARIPVDPEDPGKPIVSCTVLFGFMGQETNQTPGTYNLKNINFLGNAQKSNDVEKNSGGLSCFKARMANVNIDNCVSQRWYISMLFQDHEEYNKTNNIEYNVTNTNCFDAFNSLIYAHGSNLLKFTNCKLIGASGPVMICDHYHNTVKTGEKDDEGNDVRDDSGFMTNGQPANIVIDNCILESWVAGTEGWFVGFDATNAFSDIKALNALYTGFGYNKSYIKKLNGDTLQPVGSDESGVEMLNMIAVFKSADVAGLTTSRIRGSFTDITEDNDGKIHATGLNFEELSAMEQAIRGGGSPIFKTTNGAVGFLGENGLWADQGAPDKDLISSAKDYVNIYLPTGMATILGFYPVA